MKYLLYPVTYSTEGGENYLNLKKTVPDFNVPIGENVGVWIVTKLFKIIQPCSCHTQCLMLKVRT